jgi:hypothetical protein
MNQMIQILMLKHLKKLALCLIASMALFTACQNVASGSDGAEALALSARSVLGVGDPIPIGDADELAAIGVDPDFPIDGEYVLTASFPVTDWVPIGLDPSDWTATPFTGTLDGAGNTITVSGFDADAVDNSNYLAIFAVVGDGTATPLIENLTVNFATSAFSTTAQYVGGIAAYAQNAVFDNNTVTGTLDVTYTGTATDNFDVGGIAAYATGSSFSGNTVSAVSFTVANTGRVASNIGGEVGYSSGTLFTRETTRGASTVTSTDANSSNIGGITGYATGGSFAQITTSGSLTANSTSTGTNESTAGGVVGLAANTSFDTITAGADVNASDPSRTANSFSVGGVSGDAEVVRFSTVTVSGTITATASMPNNGDYTAYNFLAVGGITGVANAGSVNGAGSSASINAQSPNTISYAGGLIGNGSNGLTIINVVGTASVSSGGGNSNTSAGGIAGYVTQTSISNSNTSAGAITVSAPSGSGAYDYFQVFAGGLVGYAGLTSSITLCYSTRQEVIADNAAYPYSGGLVGYNYGILAYPAPPNQGSTITRSYSTNTVVADASDNGIPYAGGIAGYNSASGSLIQDCYAWGDVSADTGGQDSWAGGLTGAVAAGATVDRCYATGNVIATAGSGALPYTQTGIDTGAAAGGVVGYSYNYYDAQTTTIQNSAGLNGAVTATGSSGNGPDGTPAGNWAHRVDGHNGPTTATLTNNLGNIRMVLNPFTGLVADLDGTDTDQYPAQSVFETTLGWNFSTIWQMNATSGYPQLQGL